MYFGPDLSVGDSNDANRSFYSRTRVLLSRSSDSLLSLHQDKGIRRYAVYLYGLCGHD